jgi:hypothetical protein
VKSILFLFGREWVFFSLFDRLGKWGNAWKQDLWWTMNTKQKREEIYKLKYMSSKSIYYLLDFTKYVLSVNTNSGVMYLNYVFMFWRWIKNVHISAFCHSKINRYFRTFCWYREHISAMSLSTAKNYLSTIFVDNL